jgi:hypothetical protein
MKKSNVFAGMVVAGLVCLLSWGGLLAGMLELWMTESLLVIAFPIFAVFLGLWWKASEGEEDIPFIGY